MAQKKKAESNLDEEKKSSSKKSESSAKTDKKSSEKKPSEKKPSVFARISKYFRECKSEIKKIVWPTPKATFRNMGLVLLAMIIVGAVIFGLDFGLQKLFGLVMNVAG